MMNRMLLVENATWAMLPPTNFIKPHLEQLLMEVGIMSKLNEKNKLFTFIDFSSSLLNNTGCN